VIRKTIGKPCLYLEDHPADPARSRNRSCNPLRDLTAIRPAGKASQRDSDPLGGPEEALRDGGKAGSSMMIDGEGKIHIMFFLMADCGLLFAS